MLHFDWTEEESSNRKIFNETDQKLKLIDGIQVMSEKGFKKLCFPGRDFMTAEADVLYTIKRKHP